MIILPRQARDKHRESTQKGRPVFLGVHHVTIEGMVEKGGPRDVGDTRGPPRDQRRGWHHVTKPAVATITTTAAAIGRLARLSVTTYDAVPIN